MFNTRDSICMSLRVYTFSTAAINMAEACFLASTAMVQLLIQLECMCVTVCDYVRVCVLGEHRGLMGAVKRLGAELGV